MKPLIRMALSLILTALYTEGARCQSVSGVVNSYFSVTAVNTVSNSVTVSDATGLYNGEPILIIQMKGATINSTNSSAYGSVTAVNDAGNYEFNTICSINSNVVSLQNAMVNAYDPTGNVQLVSYTSYSDRDRCGNDQRPALELDDRNGWSRCAGRYELDNPEREYRCQRARLPGRRFGELCHTSV